MAQISIASRRRKMENVAKEFPEAEIIDVTSRAEQPWVKFSPFFPHGKIPVPFSRGYYAQSVEGIWQGLKVFEREDVDEGKFQIKNMKGIKRSSRGRGRVLGHRKGVKGTELLSYEEARKLVYLPSYFYILDNFLKDEVKILLETLNVKDIVFLDYETNTDISNIKSPLSHASLVGQYLLWKMKKR